MANIKQNPDFSEDFAAYLRGNKFSQSVGAETGNIFFTNYPYQIIIKDNTAEFLISDEGEPNERSPFHSKFSSFTGLDQINTFGWMMLLDMLKVVRLKNFMQEVRKDSKVDALFKQVHKTLATEDENDPHAEWFNKINFPGISKSLYV